VRRERPRKSRIGPRSRSLAVAALAVLLALGLSHCTPRSRPPKGPRLVLLFATCTVNKDFLAPYSPSVRYTPALARFAAQARVFLRHQTETGMSGPDFAALLTGTQADRHGIFAHPARLAEDRLLIGEAFASAGYRTYCWDSHPIATAELSYAQGVPANRVKQGMLDALDPTFRHLLTRLRDQKDLRAFVSTAFTVTHGAYAVDRVAGFCERHPEACPLPTAEILHWGEVYHAQRLDLERNYDETARRLKLTAEQQQQLAASVAVLYASRVEYLDEVFGGIVSAIDSAGLANDSLIVFTADHGEILFRANAPFKWTHGFMLAPEDLSPPLLIRAPGVAPGRYEAVSRSIDVFPTVAALAGIPLTAGTVDGVDLAPALRGTAPAPDLTAFSHTMLVPHEVYVRSQRQSLFLSFFREQDAPGMWVAARRGDRFYRLRSQRGKDLAPERYDLAADPGLTRSLYDPRSEPDTRMLVELDAYKQRLVSAQGRAASSAKGLSEAEQQERLRKLGYIEP
jgi:arylsulfatase A-like enzyme